MLRYLAIRRDRVQRNAATACAHTRPPPPTAENIPSFGIEGGPPIAVRQPSQGMEMSSRVAVTGGGTDLLREVLSALIVIMTIAVVLLVEIGL